MRVIKGFEVELPTGPDIYSIVKKVWQKSMDVIEKLLAGEPQSTSTPEPLLGLAAWHLYPDMTVLTAHPSDVLQGDDLFSTGGILTLGMISKGSASENGISWSLPLSHMRFYGKPVTKTGALGLGSERVYFRDLKFLILGAVTGDWFSTCGGINKVIDFFNALMKCWRTEICTGAQDEVPDWLNVLWEAVNEMKNTRGQARDDNGSTNSVNAEV